MYHDEAALLVEASTGRIWSIIGQPHLLNQPKRKGDRVTLMGSWDVNTGEFHTTVQEKGNAETFKAHLEKLAQIYSSARKIVIVLDNARIHHAKLIREWLAEHPAFELLFLPPYSPDYNPVENIWKQMRDKVCRSRYYANIYHKTDKYRKWASAFDSTSLNLHKVPMVAQWV